MAYILLLTAVVMWSFVGVLVKYASLMVDSNTITFCRFFFGVVFLGILIKTNQQDFKLGWHNKWVWIGAISKCINYIFENIAIAIGFAYGNIINLPIQTVFLAIMSVFYFGENITFRKIIAIALCIVGVILVSWKGSFAALISANLTTVLFIISGIGAGVHILSQKKLIGQMDSANMNFSTFLLCTVITGAPVTQTFHTNGEFSMTGLFSLVALGLITGISFYISSKVLAKLPLLTIAIVTNLSVIFSLLWSWVFFNEPITGYIISGAVTFIIGIVFLSMPAKERLSEAVKFE
ncbi:DMT family transporter [Sporomusa aerivorans]|uniref:DMT family transporter n=1 Tax=Sporomusa aerivorans TaxID=204936 RepID=UPI00352B0C1E